MQADTEVVVVGGGVIGAAILFELAKRGMRGVLVERWGFARESTGKSAAIVRMHYSNPDVVRMALRSREIFHDFPRYVGGETVYTPAGWLLMLPAPDLDRTARNVKMQQAEGVDVDAIELDRLTDLVPGISTAGVAAAFYEATSGFADPVRTTLSYVAAATGMGAEAHAGTAVTAILRDGGRVAGVETSAGVISSPRVVLAAGPWSGVVASASGFKLPLHCTREQEVVVDVGVGGGPACALSSVVDRFYARPARAGSDLHDGQVLLGRGYPKSYEVVDPEGYDPSVDGAFEAELRQRVSDRVGRWAIAPATGAVVGLYAVTPDWHPILGPMPGVPGLILATGGSGHCFKLAPSIGEMVAAAMTEQPVEYADAASFSVERFETGQTYASIYGGNRA